MRETAISHMHQKIATNSNLEKSEKHLLTYSFQMIISSKGQGLNVGIGPK